MNCLQKWTVWSALLSLALIPLGNCQTTVTSSATENEYLVERGIVYGHGGDVELKLDLAQPTAQKEPFPVLIFLFGGGFRSGSRTAWYAEIQEAAKRGYVAVTIDYRLTREKGDDGKSKYQFPAQVHDVKCAVRWLRENAVTYNIDKNRIGAVGYSSGGILALLLGLTDSSDGLEGNCGDIRISSRIQAAVNLGGATDMVMNYEVRPAYVGPLLGQSPDEAPERYKAASPVTYVSTDDPPVLTICGTRDPSLPQVKLFDEKMKMIGISHALLVIEGAEHVVYDLVNFYEDNPVWAFFDKHLKEVE